MGYRVHRYRDAIDEACRAKDDEEAERAPKETPKPTPATVLSTVVMLRGPERVTSDRGEYRNAPQEAPFSGTVYLIDRVYQRTVDELLARPGRFWTVFTPFARCVEGDRGPRCTGREGARTIEGRLRRPGRCARRDGGRLFVRR